MYRTFTRTWWRHNPSYPNGLEPCAGRQYTHRRNIRTEADARAICQEWNTTHKPGRLSRKMEYTEQ